LHMAQLMPLPLTVSCFSKIQIGFAFLVPAHPGSPGQRAVKLVCNSVTHTPIQRPSVWDYPGGSVPEETFTYSHPSRSSPDILYKLPPSTTIHSILLLHFTCLTAAMSDSVKSMKAAVVQQVQCQITGSMPRSCLLSYKNPSKVVHISVSDLQSYAQVMAMTNTHTDYATLSAAIARLQHCKQC